MFGILLMPLVDGSGHRHRPLPLVEGGGGGGGGVLVAVVVMVLPRSPHPGIAVRIEHGQKCQKWNPEHEALQHRQKSTEWVS